MPRRREASLRCPEPPFQTEPNQVQSCQSTTRLLVQTKPIPSCDLAALSFAAKYLSDDRLTARLMHKSAE